jgi:predicted membrane protein
MEPVNDTHGKSKLAKKGALGFVIIAAGILLLGFNFDLVPGYIHHILFSWQMLLIVIGAVSLFTSENRTPGLVLLFIGGFFIIPRILDFDTSKIFFPMILIGIGLLILFRRGLGSKYRTPKFTGFDNTIDTTYEEEGYINESNIFSGSKHKVVNQVFKGGKVSNIFGGTEIDLTQATLAEGRNELIIECIFGGVTLIVPSDWKVVLNMSSVMGGFSDKRSYVKESLDSRVLIVKGTAIFGGGELKSY